MILANTSGHRIRYWDEQDNKDSRKKTMSCPPGKESGSKGRSSDFSMVTALLISGDPLWHNRFRILSLLFEQGSYPVFKFFPARIVRYRMELLWIVLHDGFKEVLAGSPRMLCSK